MGYGHRYTIAGVRRGLERIEPRLIGTCDCLLWDLGQFEAGALRGNNGRDPDAARSDYLHASRKVLDCWRARLSPDEPSRLPIIIVRHAPHPAEARQGGLGVQRIRAAQCELIAQLPNCHGAGPILGMEMNDNMHPSRNGIQTYAAEIARLFVEEVVPKLSHS